MIAVDRIKSAADSTAVGNANRDRQTRLYLWSPLIQASPCFQMPLILWEVGLTARNAYSVRLALRKARRHDNQFRASYMMEPARGFEPRTC